MLVLASIATLLVASQFGLAIGSLVKLINHQPLPDFASLVSSITRATTWVKQDPKREREREGEGGGGEMRRR
jgi:hypothetical protein